jgi:hypothetical protein
MSAPVNLQNVNFSSRPPTEARGVDGGLGDWETGRNISKLLLLTEIATPKDIDLVCCENIMA